MPPSNTIAQSAPRSSSASSQRTRVAADLLLALDTTRTCTGSSPARARSTRDVQERQEVALVVGGAARVEATVAHLGLEGRRRPRARAGDASARRSGRRSARSARRRGRSASSPTASGLPSRPTTSRCRRRPARARRPTRRRAAGRRAHRRRTRWTGCAARRRARRAGQSCGAREVSSGAGPLPARSRGPADDPDTAAAAGARSRLGRGRRATTPRALAAALDSAARPRGARPEPMLPLLVAALWRCARAADRARRSSWWSTTTTRRARWPRRRRCIRRRTRRSATCRSRGVAYGRGLEPAAAPGGRARARRWTCSPPAASWRSRPTRWSSGSRRRDRRPRRCGGASASRSSATTLVALLAAAGYERVDARRGARPVLGARRHRRRVPDDRPRAGADRVLRRRGRAPLGLLGRSRSARCATSSARRSTPPPSRRVDRDRRVGAEEDDGRAIPAGLVPLAPELVAAGAVFAWEPEPRARRPRASACAEAAEHLRDPRCARAATLRPPTSPTLIERLRARSRRCRSASRRVRGAAAGARLARHRRGRERAARARARPATACSSASRTWARPSARRWRCAGSRRELLDARRRLADEAGRRLRRLAAAARVRLAAAAARGAAGRASCSAAAPPPTGRASAARSRAFADLRAGDYVVHEDHGVGRFVGFDTKTVGGVMRDYLYLEFRGDDRLYVPHDQLAKVSRYVGADGRAPALSQARRQGLAHAQGRARGSPCTSWPASCSRCTPRRQTRRGRRIAGDDEWMARLEAAFPYTETDDQARAIDAVKRTSRREQPMDRLVCGDVGFGKTEVAVRAAFKVAMSRPPGAGAGADDDPRAAAPADVPRPLPRLPGAGRDGLAVPRAGRGEAGAGRLPRRQGGRADRHPPRALARRRAARTSGWSWSTRSSASASRQKELLRQLRLEVDVLAMSATPIPRTLHMSLVRPARHLRDHDAAARPPARSRRTSASSTRSWSPRRCAARSARERPVVLPAQPGRDDRRGGRAGAAAGAGAARRRRPRPDGRARARGGDDEVPARRLRRARVDHDHRVGPRHPAGQHAHRRARRHARPGPALPDPRPRRPLRRAPPTPTCSTPTGASSPRRRGTGLATLADYTELGSGYRIAMRDLELRGAGNLLGDEQSGHVAAVGFELYCELLAEAVAELQGAPPAVAAAGARRRRRSTPTCPPTTCRSRRSRSTCTGASRWRAPVDELRELRGRARRPLRRRCPSRSRTCSASRRCGSARADWAPGPQRAPRRSRSARLDAGRRRHARAARSASRGCSTRPRNRELSLRAPDGRTAMEAATNLSLVYSR